MRVPRILLPTVLFLICVAIACAMPGAASAATKDPVLAVIAAAGKSHAITPAQTRAFRGTWLASGSALKRAPSAQRRKEVAYVRNYTTKLAKRHMLTADRLEPVLLSVKATTYVMRYVRKFPHHEQDMTIPGEVVVFKYYSGRGVQWQPFESFKQAMALVSVPVVPTQKAREYAQRMLELAVPKNGALTWEYYFPFGGPSTPWISSLSQSLATEFFQRVADQLQLVLDYPDDEYIESSAPTVTKADVDAMTTASQQAMRTFQLSPMRGGVMVKQAPGNWYLLYPFNRNQRILNGHLQVLINVQRIADETKSPVAQAIVNAGVDAVVPLLPRFDTGGWARYQLGQEANLNYEDFMQSQFKKLGAKSSNIPQRDVFAAWYTKLSDYRVTAPEITVDPGTFAPIVPVIDGYQDSVKLKWQTDKRSRDTIVLTSDSGTRVRRIVVQGGTGAHSATWDGRTSARRAVPAGTYTVSMDSIDIIGNRRHTVFPQKIVVLTDTVPPAPTSYTIIARGAKSSIVRVAVTDELSGYIDARVMKGATRVGFTRGRRTGSIDVSVPFAAAAVRAMTLKLTDSSGNTTLVPLRTPITAGSGDTGE